MATEQRSADIPRWNMKTARPYQADALNAIDKAITEGRRAILLVLATGLGKTFVYGRHAASVLPGRSLFVAHTDELISQAAGEFTDALGIVPTWEKAEREADMDCPVVCSSIQTLSRPGRLAKFPTCHFDRVFVDEAHRSTNPRYRAVIDYFLDGPATVVIGGTATPYRADGRSLSTVYEEVCYAKPLLEGVREGWLVPPRQIQVTVSGLDFSEVRASVRNGVRRFNAEQLEAELMREQPIHETARGIIEASEGRQTIVFAQNVNHAELLAAVLNRYEPDSTAAVHAGTKRKIRRDLVARFRAGQLRRLTGYGVFVEGFDSSAGCAAMARPYLSPGPYEQSIGRVCRPLPGIVDGVESAEVRRELIAQSAKPNALILDFEGNAGRHRIVSYREWWVTQATDDRQEAEEVLRLIKRGYTEAYEWDYAIALARAFADLRREQELWRRQWFKGSGGEVHRRDCELLGDGTPQGTSTRGRRVPGDYPTEKQVALLIQLGVSPGRAATFGRKQAGAVISAMKGKREKQTEVRK